jgi:hypothetical protein
MSNQTEIKMLKQQIDELREWNCHKVADLLCEDLQKLQGVTE